MFRSSLQTRRPVSYQEYLAGVADEVGGGEVAAFQNTASASRSIAIGVTTGVLIFLVNRWLERLLK